MKHTALFHHHPVKKLALVYHSAFINELEGKLGVFANCNRFINHFKHALQTKAQAKRQ